MVIRKLTEPTENYKKLQGNYNELTANYINMKNEIETIKKGQECWGAPCLVSEAVTPHG